ncbi:MAG: endonuclease/exonuclease/phosphatase family protein [Chloroflexota bacterium]
MTLGFIILLSSQGRLHWSADVAATFLDYFLLLLLISLVILAWRKQWLFFAVASLFFCWGIFDLFGFASAPIYADQNPAVRLMVFNVYFENQEVEAVQAEIERHDPDIIYLMEYPSNANPIMRLELNDDYPYQLIEPSRFTMGTALYSKHPFVESKTHQFAGTRIPISEVLINVDGKQFVFVGGHPWPPLPPWGQLHREQLDDIIGVAESALQLDVPLVVAGDFNTPPQAFMLNQLAQRVGVNQVRQQFDLRKTYSPFPAVFMSLDHVLVSEDIRVSDYSYAGSAGSDHVPIVVDFSIAP